MHLGKILVAIGMALSSSRAPTIASAADAITVEEYAQLKNEKGVAILVPYLQGAADAMWSANTALIGGGKAPLYCSDSDKPLSATELMVLTDRLLANLIRRGETVPATLYVTTAAANAIVLAHPCNR